MAKDEKVAEQKAKQDEKPEFPQDGGGAARPIPLPMDDAALDDGMTLRQYAAIHLNVPESGIEWLDWMIKVSNSINQTVRVQASMKAMQIQMGMMQSANIARIIK